MAMLESHVENIKTLPKLHQDESSAQETVAVRNVQIRNGYVGNLLRDGESLEDLRTRSVDHVMQRWADFVTSKSQANNSEECDGGGTWASAGSQVKQLGPAWKDLMPLAKVRREAFVC
jgi:hypothetical protein